MLWSTGPDGLWDLSWNYKWYDWVCHDGESHGIDCVCQKPSSFDTGFHAALRLLERESGSKKLYNVSSRHELATAAANSSGGDAAACPADGEWIAHRGKCYSQPAGDGVLLDAHECAAACAAADATLPCVRDSCLNSFLASLTPALTQWLGIYQVCSCQSQHAALWRPDEVPT